MDTTGTGKEIYDALMRNCMHEWEVKDSDPGEYVMSICKKCGAFRHQDLYNNKETIEPGYAPHEYHNHVRNDAQQPTPARHDATTADINLEAIRRLVKLERESINLGYSSPNEWVDDCEFLLDLVDRLTLAPQPSAAPTADAPKIEVGQRVIETCVPFEPYINVAIGTVKRVSNDWLTIYDEVNELERSFPSGEVRHYYDQPQQPVTPSGAVADATTMGPSGDDGLEKACNDNHLWVIVEMPDVWACMRCGLLRSAYQPPAPTMGPSSKPSNYEPSYVVVNHNGTYHAVFAGGSPEDGSLWGFETACGLDVKDNQSDPAWRETSGASVTCKHCLSKLPQPPAPSVPAAKAGVKLSAANSVVCANVKRMFNAKIYKLFLTKINTEGEYGALRWLLGGYVSPGNRVKVEAELTAR